ncbi:hypothetical protein ACN20G_16460 [Streptomyces sp. BI20]|uniref:hypothetical protein n=1 Tax=Streptomyces sp. BI20 TaxID=3403460 RepID=UPI003C77BD8A
MLGRGGRRVGRVAGYVVPVALGRAFAPLLPVPADPFLPDSVASSAADTPLFLVPLLLLLILGPALALLRRRSRPELARLVELGVPERTGRTALRVGVLVTAVPAAALGWGLGAEFAPPLPAGASTTPAWYDAALVLCLLVVPAVALPLTRDRSEPRPAPPGRHPFAGVAAVLGGLALVGALGLGLAPGADADTVARCAAAGVVLLFGALLARTDLLLHLLARLADRRPPGRIALRALARSPRRATRVVAVGAAGTALVVGTLGTLAGAAAHDRAVHEGPRRPGQVEVLLTTRAAPADVARATAGALPPGIPLVRGTALGDPDALAAAPGPALARPWRVAARPDSPLAGTGQGIEVVDDAAKFALLTGRPWTVGEEAALRAGRLLVLSADHLDGDRAALTRPAGSESSVPGPVVPAVPAELPVDPSAARRAAAFVSSAAARAWGAQPVDYSVLADTLVPDPSPALGRAVTDAVARVTAGPPADAVRVERGPVGPSPALWWAALALALAVLAVPLGPAAVAGADALAADLGRLRRLGLAPRALRRAAHRQAPALALLAVVLGIGGGAAVAAALSWPRGAPMLLPALPLAVFAPAAPVLAYAYAVLTKPLDLKAT